MGWPPFSVIVSAIFVAYISHSLYTIYGLFYPKPCSEKINCIRPYLAKNPQLELRVYTSLQTSPNTNNMDLVWKWSDFKVNETVEKQFNVTIPKKTRNNGTLHVHIFLHPVGQYRGQMMTASTNSLTMYSLPQTETFKLMSDGKDKDSVNKTSTDKRRIPVTHWRSRLTVSVMEENIKFDKTQFPPELHRFIKWTPEGQYLPMLYIDELSNRIKDLMPINTSVTEMPLTIVYRPISVGKLRLWVNMQESMKMLHSLGFTEKDTDEMKGIFADTNFYLLMLTFAVAAFHLLFDFLAFKNDISYWKKRETMIGLSTTTVVWRCVSTIIIFFYLMDEETSLLILIPAGIGTIIEMWKVSKAFKIKIVWSGVIPKLQFGATSDQEKETDQFDSQAMKYLSYILYPLCIAGAIYSLLYTPHKSWKSWCVQSLVNGVYAFGFLFMMPQLFVNYKLKSVAHLPWRAFMYKAFNTFIDDVFAFIITMPTAHRLACFRDDIIFLIYLYQRWLYPVDKKRVNEYGQCFDEDEKKTQ